MNPRIRRHGRTETKNGNAGFLGSNNETPPSTKQKRKARSVPFPNVDGVKNTDGLPAPKSRTMHASKDPTSSPNPTKQVPAGNRDKLVEQQDQLLFTESAVMDYVTLKGIENRFGIKKDDIPVGIFKELIDNSLDRVETIALTRRNRGFVPEISVQIISCDDESN